MRSKQSNKNAIKAMKEKETQILRSFHDNAVNVLYGRYFPLMLMSLPDPKFLMSSLMHFQYVLMGVCIADLRIV